MLNKLNYGFHKVYGRGRQSITSRHRGGGKKVIYKNVDFFRFLPNVKGKLLSTVRDSYRSGHIGLVGYTNGIVSYMLLPSVKVDNFITVYRSETPEHRDYSRVGISCPLYCVKVGSSVYNVESNFLKGGSIARSAGTKAILMKKYKTTGLLRLPSGLLILVSLKNFCSIGEVSNEHHKLESLKKAGVNRWKGKRPIVRGIAMNPVDHPHGGRTNGGKVPCTAWGRIAKGPKTRKKKRHCKDICL